MKSKLQKLNFVLGSLIVSNSLNMVSALADPSKPFTVKSAVPDQALTKMFRSSSRWCGADGACSVPIDEDTTVWFFGDTFIKKDNSGATSKSKSKSISKSKSKSGSESKSGSGLKSKSNNSAADTASSFDFINNTVAVQKLKGQKVDFFWRNINGQRWPILIPKTVGNKSYYWPGDGFVLDEKLFVVNKVIVPRPVKFPGDFGFEWKSDDILQITNAGETPTKWQWKGIALPEHKRTALMGTALLLKDDFAYFYSSLQKFARGPAVHPTGVARIPQRALLAMDMSKFEFWNGQKWVPDIDQASIIFEDGASEMTVTEVAGEPYLVTTYMAPMSSDICMRFARKPEGPWSDPIKVYQCPEHLEVVLGRRTAVYSAKAHPEFSHHKDEIVVSYCPNPGEMKHYLARPDLYYPRIIRVTLKK
ncbi:MAG: DUF4185 domain-containing protein [Cyanobacteria bacterium SZAS LIN-5]|nr:DUF4185 domain-containing protein [Cyanobacteria bacterium SZAS LIN-5]